MSYMKIIARALQGDEDALAELEAIHPQSAGIAARTRDRLKGLGTACAAAV